MPRTVAPSVNVTVPVGGMGSLAVTVAVRVTSWPYWGAVGDAVKCLSAKCVGWRPSLAAMLTQTRILVSIDSRPSGPIRGLWIRPIPSRAQSVPCTSSKRRVVMDLVSALQQRTR